MIRTLVSLDLETTGLQAERDAILEIGAVRFRGDEALETYSTFVNPGRPIPYKITQLTGISNENVSKAPELRDVLPQLARFVGGSTIVGHNIAFELSFLNRHGTLINQPSLDTFEVAGILVPHSERYSLAVLAQKLGVELSGPAHRALNDALTAQRLLAKLIDRAAALDIRLIQEINRLAANSNWALRGFFRDVEESRARAPRVGRSLGTHLQAKAGDDTDALAVSLLADEDAGPLKPADEKQRVDVPALRALLEPGGVFEKQFPNYEYRSQQVDMLDSVAQALNEGYHLLVEAGTGTGKSIAYLMPAAYFAVQNQRPVVISTNTINLQEQLYRKDVPDLQKMIPLEFRVAILKGRSNYLCLRRLNAMRQRLDLDNDELRVLARVLVWQRSTVTGDEGELLLPNAKERAVWQRLNSQSESCLAETCPHRQRGRCFFYRARRRAERAHLIIVNHALLLSDVAVEGRVLPEYKHLIIDEAHHVEAAVTRQLSFAADRFSFERMLGEVSHGSAGRHSGTLTDVLMACRPKLPQDRLRDLEKYTEGVRAQVESARGSLQGFFAAARAHMDEHFEGGEDGGYDRRLRITDGARSQPSWSDVEIAWEDSSVALTRISQGLEGLYDRIEAVEDHDIEGLDDLLQNVTAHILRIREDRDQMTRLVSEPDAGSIYWVEHSPQNDGFAFHAAPLHVGDLMRKTLFEAKESVILTSATLRTSDSFDFIRERLSAEAADELAVGSPFDYKTSTLVYLPTDIPEPRQPGYQQAVQTTLLGLCKATQGRTLILFTSYSQLRTTARAIGPQLADEQITVLEQGDGTSRQQLLQSFRTVPRTVLMGTRSFWEGIDVMGEALSCLAIVRLPFSVPSEPIFAARCEQFDDPFNEYSVPETVLRFRQGFGRLIRSRTDRGIVAVLDSRLISKQYGKAFLDSLPDCTVEKGPALRLAKAAEEWLAAGPAPEAGASDEPPE